MDRIPLEELTDSGTASITARAETATSETSAWASICHQIGFEI